MLKSLPVPRCKKCFKVFKNSRYLQKHQLRKTPCDTKKPCHICGHVFKNSTLRNRHLRTHLARIKRKPVPTVTWRPPVAQPVYIHQFKKIKTRKNSLTRKLQLKKEEIDGLEDRLRQTETRRQELQQALKPDILQADIIRLTTAMETHPIKRDNKFVTMFKRAMSRFN